MKKLWIVESRTKGKRRWDKVLFCPSKSKAIFMIGRTYEVNKVYRIIETDLTGDQLFFNNLFGGCYNEHGIRVFGEELK